MREREPELGAGGDRLPKAPPFPMDPCKEAPVPGLVQGVGEQDPPTAHSLAHTHTHTPKKKKTHPKIGSNFRGWEEKCPGQSNRLGPPEHRPGCAAAAQGPTPETAGPSRTCILPRSSSHSRGMQHAVNALRNELYGQEMILSAGFPMFSELRTTPAPPDMHTFP